jgi:two-component system LytT family response regulator
MTKRILIVDDEETARQGIRSLIARRVPAAAAVDAALEVHEAKNGVEALQLIADLRPAVVFLDVEMPVMSGFDVLMQTEARDFQVIFQTAHGEFALRAFEENACDYLLKPFTDERFYKALDRALDAGAGSSAALERLDAYLRSEKRFLKHLVFRAGLRAKVVPVAEILYLLSEDHATTAYMDDGDFVHASSLEALEAKLDPEVFLRIHRNALVNREAIKSVKSGAPMAVTMRDGRVLVVAKERRARLRPLLMLDY